MSAVLQRMAGAVDADDPEAAETARLSALMPADETQLLYSLCLHGRGELGLAPDEYAALTMVLLRLLAFKPASGVGESAEKKTLTRAETPPSGAVASTAAAPAAVVATPGPVGGAAVKPPQALPVPSTPAVPAPVPAVAAGTASSGAGDHPSESFNDS
eukprot:gene3389-4830_t